MSEADRVTVYRDAANNWRWRRSAPNGRILSASSEGYTHRTECIEMARRCNGADETDVDYEWEGA
jgi:uncharacterized protein YegP (UPF0339 family)